MSTKAIILEEAAYFTHTHTQSLYIYQLWLKLFLCKARLLSPHLPFLYRCWPPRRIYKDAVQYVFQVLLYYSLEMVLVCALSPSQAVLKSNPHCEGLGQVFRGGACGG